MDVNELKNNLFDLPGSLTEDVQSDTIIIYGKNKEQNITIHLSDEEPPKTPTQWLKSLTVDQIELFNDTIWDYYHTPVAMRRLDEWKKHTAIDKFFNNRMLLNECPIDNDLKKDIAEEQSNLMTIIDSYRTN